MRTIVTIIALAVVLSAFPHFATPEAQALSGTPSFAVYAAPSSLPNADNAGEPSIGVDRNTNAAGGGTVMYQAYQSTYKVVFNDATTPASVTWTSVPSGNIINVDPILATDSVTGRTFAGGESGTCSNLHSTDNDGTSWNLMGNPCGGADHETIGSGAWHGSAPLGATYSRAVYYCAQLPTDICSTSGDGGVTFGAPVSVSGACSSLHGHVKVSADGTAYVPNNNCGSNVGGFKTTTNGASWTSYVIPQAATAARGFDPSVATTPNNILYEAWSAASSYHPMFARSTDGGTSWDRVTDLANTVSPALVASTFQAAVAGDDSRVAIAFLGTSVGGGAATPFDNGYGGVWYLYVSYSYDGGLSWTTVQADPDPVQRGCIWDGGGSNVCRNLLDFMDASVTKDGRVVVGYADGCLACSTASQSTHAYATIARQSTGKGLYAAYDTGGATVPGAPTLNSATAGNAQVALAWSAPSSDGGAAITNYNVYRGTTSGGESLLTTVGNVLSYTDTSVTNGATYYYKVAAKNSVGTGALSNEKSATPSAPNNPPTACFTHAESGSTTNVNGSCSSDTDGTIASYDWNWGDGSAHGSGATASHSYSAGGTFTVTLTVTDNGGATGTASQNVTITAPANKAPTACFSHSETGLQTSVNGGCSTDSDGTIASYDWNWGDGSAHGTGATTTHTYAAAGTYTVTLTVTDNGGATASTSQSVTVTSDPDPSTPTLTNGVATSGSSGASGTWQYYKISVPAGATQLKVWLNATQSCGLLGCSPDLDLYVRQGAKPDANTWDCRPYTGSSTESCTIANPAANWWYVGINVYAGSSALNYKVTALYS